MLLIAAVCGAAAQTIPVPENVQLQTDVVYSRRDGTELKADLYLPKGDGPFPAVVYIHGGAWSGGVRTQLRRQAAHMAVKGVAGFAVDYRLSGQAKFPAALHDVKEAVRWVRANAARYRIDPNRIAAAGSSAGGHLAAMLGVTRDVSGFEGDGCCREFSSRVTAVVAFNPVLDLAALRDRDMVREFLGDTDPAAASPIRYAGKGAAPFLILHGTADQIVPYQQAVEMTRKLKEAGVEAQLFTGEGAPHTFYGSKQWFEPTLRAVEAFLLRHLGKQGS